ncbi:50S ribosomal protein L13 [Candidatus Moduliflexus flocculans]|uniref:Large ribosomal subunit protein uL13 n=1 Tax=Candidatus Moduliflexus flocculans TaxID=1499966 RepID=A0A0S6W5A8_9BACT|nr:50S ribosomal protein L13 [Candidatus Moduliflexus flocculans]
MKTEFVRKEDVQHKWYVVDAQNVVLGRLAVEIAKRLRGKHKPNFSPHIDNGDYIVVVNADKIRLTGKKLTDKVYYRHTGYPGGLKSMTAKEMLARKPEQMLELAVKRMLPKNRLGRAMYKKMKVYAAPDHPHAAQQPEVLTLQPRYNN